MRRQLTTALRALLGMLALVTLALGASPASAQQQGPNIVGSILDTGGSPVEGAAVTVSAEQGTFSAEATSDAQGTFVVPVPGPGQYRVSVDQQSVPTGVNVPQQIATDGAPVTVREEEDATVTLELRRAESLRGTLQTETGEPLEGVRITAESVDGGFSEAATTDEQGNWEIFVPSPGRYRVALDTGTLPEGVEPRAGTSTELTVDVFSSQQRAILFSFGRAVETSSGSASRPCS